MDARSIRLGLGAAALVGALGVLVGSAQSRAARKVPIMRTDEVRPGMKGHGVTVFEGGASDRFDIEVVDVIPNYLPRQDAILFRSSDPRLKHTGIVGGMSGSPIFIDGKLVGALAYGWRFNKDPLGGITPIENMLRVGELPFRPDVLPRPRARERRGAAAWVDTILGLRTSPLPARRRPADLDPATGLVSLGVPMSVSGFGPSATRLLSETVGLVPTRGGGGGPARGPQKPKSSWKPGDAVSVVLISGDNWAAPNGTVTWVHPKGDRLLAFGHPMFGDGPTNIPFADARIHTIIASVDRSVKISSPKTVQGTMVQDRQAAIALRTGVTAPTIPITTTLVAPERKIGRRVSRNEIAFAWDLTPGLAGAVLTEAVSEAGQDSAAVVATIVHEIGVETSKGPRTVRLEEEAFFPHGASARGMSRSRGVAVLGLMLENDFEVARIRTITQNVSLAYGTPAETIEEVEVPTGDVRAGDVLSLQVRLRPYRGKARTETIPIRIPDDAADETIQVSIAGGDFARPYRPMPADLDELLDNVQAWYPSRSIVVSIHREAEGLSTHHGLLDELPDSVLESLKRTGGTRKPVRLKQLARRVIPTKVLIDGQHSFKLEVLKPNKF